MQLYFFLWNNELLEHVLLNSSAKAIVRKYMAVVFTTCLKQEKETSIHHPTD